MSENRQQVLILGGGINGAALARELAINAVPVALVETADLAFGATAYSSRLIHGGLRYLEYGEFDLVRESLAERTRLLRLAPQFVRPLELFIPVETRLGGLSQSVARVTGLDRWWAGRQEARGLWLVETGLWLYDRYARDSTLPHHRAWRQGAAGTPPVDAVRYRWLCSYFDAQLRYPERFVMALLADAQAAAKQHGTSCAIWTYHEARLQGRRVELVDNRSGAVAGELEPAAIVNATGAWVDRTLGRLGVDCQHLMAGTKGSHLVIYNTALSAALAAGGIYAEAADGRPVFILPFGSACLVGTTDLPFSGDPADAVASPDEIDYLLKTVNHIFPQVKVSPEDVELHYCGVRPLPATSATKTSAITRRHWVHRHALAPLPLFSVIGGKLTTCRSLAETTADLLLEELGRQRIADSRERTVPGGQDYPQTQGQLDEQLSAIASRYRLSRAAVERIWALWGTQSARVLEELGEQLKPDETLAGTLLPRSFVGWCIQHEHARTLGDLVERRLMLLYEPNLSGSSLVEMAEALVAAGYLAATQVQAAIVKQTERLRDHFGKRVAISAQ